MLRLMRTKKLTECICDLKKFECYRRYEPIECCDFDEVFGSMKKKSYAKRATKNMCEKYTESGRQISLGVALQRPAWIGNLRWN